MMMFALRSAVVVGEKRDDAEQWSNGYTSLWKVFAINRADMRYCTDHRFWFFQIDKTWRVGRSCAAYVFFHYGAMCVYVWQEREIVKLTPNLICAVKYEIEWFQLFLNNIQPIVDKNLHEMGNMYRYVDGDAWLFIQSASHLWHPRTTYATEYTHISQRFFDRQTNQDQ